MDGIFEVDVFSKLVVDGIINIMVSHFLEQTSLSERLL